MQLIGQTVSTPNSQVKGGREASRFDDACCVMCQSVRAALVLMCLKRALFHVIPSKDQGRFANDSLLFRTQPKCSCIPDEAVN